MSYAVLVVLSLLWLAFFLPSLLQARRASSPLDSAATFQTSLTRISTGHAVTPAEAEAAAARRPRRSRRAIARQRDILLVLGVSVLASVLLAVSFGGSVRWLVVVTGAAFVAYIAALRARAVAATAPRRKVVAAPATYPVPAPGATSGLDVVPSVRRRGDSQSRPELERVAG